MAGVTRFGTGSARYSHRMRAAVLLLALQLKFAVGSGAVERGGARRALQQTAQGSRRDGPPAPPAAPLAGGQADAGWARRRLAAGADAAASPCGSSANGPSNWLDAKNCAVIMFMQRHTTKTCGGFAAQPAAQICDWSSTTVQGITCLNGKVTVLGLQDCGLTEVPTTIADLTELTLINLSDNLLTSLPGQMGDLPNVTAKSYLTGTGLGLARNKFMSCPSSKIIKMAGGSIFGSPIAANPQQNGSCGIPFHAADGKALADLAALDVTKKCIGKYSAEDIMSGWLCGWKGPLSEQFQIILCSGPRVTQILLPDCALSGITPDSIGLMSKLNGLVLARNALSGALPATIGNLSKMITLDFAENELTSVPATIKSLRYLNQCYFNANRLTSVPAELGQLSMFYFDYSTNTFSIPSGDLDLSSNLLRVLPPEIGNIKGLLKLDLDGNILEDLPLELQNLSILGYFSAAKNPLRSLTGLKLSKLMMGMGSQRKGTGCDCAKPLAKRLRCFISKNSYAARSVNGKGKRSYCLPPGGQLAKFSIEHSIYPAEAEYTVVNRRPRLVNYNCRVGTGASGSAVNDRCALTLAAHSADYNSVDYGGLNLSITLDANASQTNYATDLNNGTYTVTVPAQWSAKLGHHSITLKVDGNPIRFCRGGIGNDAQCGAPERNPFSLTVLPILCLKDHKPSSDLMSCVCSPGTVKQGDICKPCSAGRYPRTFGTIGCFYSGYSAGEMTKFRKAAKDSKSECVDCKSTPCVSCLGGNDVRIKPGWNMASSANKADKWAAKWAAKEMVSGKNISLFACPGGSGACRGTILSSVNSTNSTICNVTSHLTGELCSICQHGRYKAQKSECVECGKVDKKVMAMLACYIVSLMLAVALPQRVAALRSADIGFIRSTKICVSYFQVCSVLGLVLDMPLDVLVPHFDQVTQVAQVLWGNLRSIFGQFRCAPLSLSYYHVWLTEVVGLPSCIVLCLAVVYKKNSWRWPARKARYAKDFKQRLSLALFLFYPSICSKIFSIMQCRQLGEKNSHLISDMSISCQDPWYTMYRTIAQVLAVLVPFGVPLALGVHFFRQHRKYKKEFESRFAEETIRVQVDGGAIALDDGADSAAELTYLRLMGSFSSLVSDYRPETFYFELVDFFRKAVYTGALLFLDQGSTSQLLVGIFFSLAFFVLQVLASPFKRAAHNLLKQMELLCMLSTFQVCLVLNLRKKGEETAVDEDASYDYFLVFCVLVMLVIYLASIAFAVWRSIVLRREIETEMQQMAAKTLLYHSPGRNLSVDSRSPDSSQGGSLASSLSSSLASSRSNSLDMEQNPEPPTLPDPEPVRSGMGASQRRSSNEVKTSDAIAASQRKATARRNELARARRELREQKQRNGPMWSSTDSAEAKESAVPVSMWNSNDSEEPLTAGATSPEPAAYFSPNIQHEPLRRGKRGDRMTRSADDDV